MWTWSGTKSPERKTEIKTRETGREICYTEGRPSLGSEVSAVWDGWQTEKLGHNRMMEQGEKLPAQKMSSNMRTYNEHSCTLANNTFETIFICGHIFHQ
jgi:hypothetical protein